MKKLYFYAQVLRSKIRPEAVLSMVNSDEHAPRKFRVNGVVRNRPEFYSEFDVKLEDSLYLAPEERMHIW